MSKAKLSLPRGIRSRGAALFVDVSWRGKRRTATVEPVPGETPQEHLVRAKAKQSELKAELMGGTSAPGKKTKTVSRSWTLGEACKRTMESAWRGRACEPKMAYMVKHVEARWGKTRLLSDITTVDLDEWVIDLEEAGKSNATINRHLAALSKIMTFSIPRGGLAAKPKFPRKHEGVGRIRFVTDQEEEKALQYLRQCEAPEILAAWIILIDTGMRVGELRRLEARDCDFKKGVVSIWKTKADVPRSVPMTKRVRTVLANWCQRKAPSALVLDVHGNFLRVPWARLKAHLDLVGDTQFVPHVLRHTFASRLVQEGAHLLKVQKLMGHKTLAITQRYSHLAPDDLFSAVDLLDQRRGPELDVVSSPEGSSAQ